MKETDKNIIIVFFFICLFSILAYLNDSNSNKEDLEKKSINYKSTIGFLSRVENVNKSYNIIYYFYNSNNRILSKINKKSSYESNVKKYFLVKFDSKNPSNNEIYLDNEIQPDSMSLVKAGFKYIKYHEHNIATNTYIERYKWQ